MFVRREPVGRFASHDRFHELVALLLPAGGVSKCLHYPGMTPKGFDRFAGRDAKAHGHDWADVCPAYALALVSSGGYQLPQDSAELEVLWDELGGDSSKLWSEVDDVVRRSWAWLDAHDPSFLR